MVSPHLPNSPNPSNSMPSFSLKQARKKKTTHTGGGGDIKIQNWNP